MNRHEILDMAKDDGISNIPSAAAEKFCNSEQEICISCANEAQSLVNLKLEEDRNKDSEFDAAYGELMAKLTDYFQKFGKNSKNDSTQPENNAEREHEANVLKKKQKWHKIKRAGFVIVEIAVAYEVFQYFAPTWYAALILAALLGIALGKASDNLGDLRYRIEAEKGMMGQAEKSAHLEKRVSPTERSNTYGQVGLVLFFILIVAISRATLVSQDESLARIGVSIHPVLVALLFASLSVIAILLLSDSIYKIGGIRKMQDQTHKNVKEKQTEKHLAGNAIRNKLATLDRILTARETSMDNFEGEWEKIVRERDSKILTYRNTNMRSRNDREEDVKSFSKDHEDWKDRKMKATFDSIKTYKEKVFKEDETTLEEAKKDVADLLELDRPWKDVTTKSTDT